MSLLRTRPTIASPAKAGVQLGDMRDDARRPFPSVSQLGPGLRRGRERGVTISVLLGLFLAVPALADSGLPPAALANTQLRDPALEAKAQALMETLRCVVCQGQSIADSDADLAGDMRAMVRQRILAGESPAAIRRWMVERYGDYVSYDPPFSAVTAPLWIAPILLLAIGGWLARGSFKRRRRG